MAANKTVPSTQNVSDFVAAIPETPRRADAQALLMLMQQATGEEPRLWGPSIIGFGSRHYKYESGREGDTLVVGFSPRKPAIVLYGLRSAPEVDAMLTRLGKHTTGKGCVYIKKVTDVDLEVLRAMIAQAYAAGNDV